MTKDKDDWLAEGRRLQAYAAEPDEFPAWLHNNADRLIDGCERAEIWCVIECGPNTPISLHRTKAGAEQECATRVERLRPHFGDEAERFYAVGAEVLHA